MKLYEELAEWWPVFSPPKVFAKQAASYARILQETCAPRRVLELGCGGGSVAYHLKKHFQMDLVDLSPEMLKMAARLNPECPVHQGDMRTIRLGSLFDAVFINDAVMYMTTERDLRMAMATAYTHLRPGGAALFVPDCTRETFLERTEYGGGENGPRSGRYLAWMRDPDPSDTVYDVDFAILLSGKDGTRCVHDPHTFGVFPRECWLSWLEAEGFRARQVEGKKLMFLGIKATS